MVRVSLPTFKVPVRKVGTVVDVSPGWYACFWCDHALVRGAVKGRLAGLGDAGFDDGGFVLLLVVIEDGEPVALNGELYLLAEGDLGGFGPGEVEFWVSRRPRTTSSPELKRSLK
jgi:hypothetical protein